MAKFNVVGFDEIEKMIVSKSSKATKVASSMLSAGAEVLIEAQKQSIEDYDLVDKGEMKESIKATSPRNKRGSIAVDIYPQGRDSKGVRNATKAFVAEYGKSGQQSKPWQSVANERCYGEVHKAMRKAWEKEE